MHGFLIYFFIYELFQKAVGEDYLTHSINSNDAKKENIRKSQNKTNTNANIFSWYLGIFCMKVRRHEIMSFSTCLFYIIYIYFFVLMLRIKKSGVKHP